MVRIQKINLLCVLLILVSTFANAQTEVDGVYYKIIDENEKTVEVCPVPNIADLTPYSGGINIPPTVTVNTGEGDQVYNVTKIGENAFKDASDLTSISIPASVKSIGKNAFYGCSGLTKVIFASVNDICTTTFANPYANPLSNTYAQLYKNSEESLATIEIGQNVSRINAYAFYGIKNITAVYISGNVTSIGNEAFNKCSGFDKVFYADMIHLTTMSYESSSSNPIVYAKEVWLNNRESQLTEVAVSNDVKPYAFRGFKNLTKVTFAGDNVINIGTDAFYDCTKLSEIDFPSSLKTIGTNAFHNTKLNSIIIPENIISIDNEAFQGCTNLEFVSIEAPLTVLSYRMFDGCTNLEKVTLPKATTTIGNRSFRGCSSLSSLPEGENLVKFDENSFEGCKGFTELTLPKTIQTIGNCAFKDCTNLTDLFIPEEVTNLTIGSSDWVFSGSKSLKIYSNTATAPKSSVNPFYGYESIKIYIPKGETSGYDKSPWTELNPTTYQEHTITYYVDGGVFYSKNVEVGQPVPTPEEQPTREGWDFAGWDDEIPSLMPDDDLVIKGHFEREYISTGGDDLGVKYFLSSDSDTPKAKVTGYEHSENPGIVKINSAIVIEGDSYTIDSIGANAFNGAENLTEIDLSNATTNIGIALFEGCSDLEKVILPAALTEITEKMFYRCSKLSTLDIPSKVTTIGVSAFEGCTKYNIDHLPLGLQTLGKSAFNSCGIVEITLPSNIKTMDESVFQSCVDLKRIVFDKEMSLTVLPAYTFSGCSNLESFTLPTSTTIIGINAFASCGSLIVLALNNILEISTNAFTHCDNLKAITLPIINTLENLAFSSCRNVEMITIESETPPSVGESTFTDIYNKATLCVKNADQFKDHEIWTQFEKIETIASSPKLTYKLDDRVIDEIPLKPGTPVDHHADPNADDNPKGRAFSGWKDEPIIMPNKDSVIVGSLKYQRIYMAEGTTDVLYSDSLYYGCEVSHPDKDLKKEGLSYTIIKPFEAMPAKDSTLYVSYNLTTAPTGKDIIFNNDDQDLINYVNLKEGSGTLKYSLDKKNYSTEIKGKDAQTYKVYYRVDGVTEHYNTEPDSIVGISIAPRPIDKLTITLKENKNGYTYNGNEYKPEVESVYIKIDNIETLIPKEEYKVGYGNNVNAGTEAKVYIEDNKEDGNYIIKKDSTKFEIKKADVALETLFEEKGEPSVINGLVYDGTSKALINGGSLKQPAPGTLEYSKDGKNFEGDIPTGTDAGTYQVYYMVKGNNNYNNSAISESISVTIAPKELTSKELEITLTPDSYTYDGSEKKPVVTVKYGEIVFTKEKDFTVSYENNKDVGKKALVIITDKDGGNYIVSGSKTFEITRAASSLTKAPTAQTNIIYSGTDQALINAGASNTGNVQYSLSKDEKTFSETIPTGKNAGDYKIYYRVKGDANHSDTKIDSVKATIAPKEINSFSLSQSSYTYDGGEMKPTVTVTWNNMTVQGSEYAVSYSNNKNAGTATVTVTDKEGGNFKVSGSKTFTITPAALTISADNYEIFEGETIPEFTVKYDGFVNKETEAVLTKKPILRCSAIVGSKPGDYAINVSGAEAANYKITHKNGKLTILVLKFVAGGDTSKDEDDPATYQITSTGSDGSTTPTVTIIDDKDVGGAFAIPETVTYHSKTFTVTEIGANAFENNTNLSAVTIPSSITTIGDKAFKGCSNLKSITVYITTPISLAVAGTRGSDGASVFEGVDKTTCVLYVPDGSVDLYKAAPVWCEFKHIVPISTLTGINGVNVTEGEPFDIYNLQGRKVKSKAYDLKGLPRGIYIINGKKVAVK